MTNVTQLVGTAELQSIVDGGSARIIDCRFDLKDPDAGRRAYREAHIPGAVYADMDRDLAAPVTPASGRHPLPDVDDFALTLGRFGVDHSMPVVVYDRASGALAARAWWLLRWLGHTNVRLLDGGIDCWVAEDRELGDGEEQVSPRRFVAHARNECVITTEDLLDGFESIASMRLIDARDAARFRGEVEPIDPVAGHIPGALNVPLTESLNADGTWKSRSRLEALWRRVLGEDKTEPWAVMCGSGVTACHLAISGIEAGYSEPSLYVGSWSEWIRDPARPIGLGES